MADEVRRETTVHGADGILPYNSWDDRLPSPQKPPQDWSFLSFGIQHPPRLTWGILKDVLEGLRLYLDEGGHNRQAYFKIEKQVEGNLKFVGFGRLCIRRMP